MRVSIVTNAFNQGRFLAEAMNSVLSQDWDDLEYVVVDPGSSDNTLSVVEQFQCKYPGRIRLIQERDRGPADGLNKAFMHCSGEVFGFLNADDFYLPGCIRSMARVLEEHPQASAVYGDGYIADAKGAIRKRAVSTDFDPRRFVYGGCFVLQQSTFYRATAFHSVGGFNAANRTSWDAEILVDMATAGMRLVHSPGYWSVFRIHSDSITGSQRMASESKRNHDRYFRNIIGRDRNVLDYWRQKSVRIGAYIRNPRATLAKIEDRVKAPKTPDWIGDGVQR